jgi:transposase InsO family protein
MVDKRKGSQRHIPHRFTAEEEQHLYAMAMTPEFRDATPEQIVAILASRGEYYGSPRTLYRILKKRSALHHRRRSKKPTPPRPARYLEVTSPNQVWSWDITWLKTEVHGLFLYAYTIIDLYDRSIVGWTIEERESDTHAHTLFARVVRDQKVVPEIVHADNGHPMRGMTLAVFLDSLAICRSYSRPRHSNDNATIESFHKTLKYSVGYPSSFSSLADARRWYATFIDWYNTTHLHSGIGYVTPLQRRSGEAEAIYESRNQTLKAARSRHPARWRRGKTRTYGSLPVKAFYRPINAAA